MPIHIVKIRDGAKGSLFLQKEFNKSRINSYPEGWSADAGDENEV